MEKNIITIILVKIEIKIIQTIIFGLENMMYLFSMSLQKRLCNWELWKKNAENVQKENSQI
jgi:hypothetical protein